MVANMGEGVIPGGGGFFVGVEEGVGVHDAFGFLE